MNYTVRIGEVIPKVIEDIKRQQKKRLYHMPLLHINKRLEINKRTD
jgi:hypothetical protein